MFKVATRHLKWPMGLVFTAYILFLRYRAALELDMVWVVLRTPVSYIVWVFNTHGKEMPVLGMWKSWYSSMLEPKLEGNLATTISRWENPTGFVNIYGIAHVFRITLKLSSLSLSFFFFGLTSASQTEIPRDKLKYIRAQLDCWHPVLGHNEALTLGRTYCSSL